MVLNPVVLRKARYQKLWHYIFPHVVSRSTSARDIKFDNLKRGCGRFPFSSNIILNDNTCSKMVMGSSEHFFHLKTLSLNVLFLSLYFSLSETIREQDSSFATEDSSVCGSAGCYSGQKVKVITMGRSSYPDVDDDSDHVSSSNCIKVELHDSNSNFRRLSAVFEAIEEDKKEKEDLSDDEGVLGKRQSIQIKRQDLKGNFPLRLINESMRLPSPSDRDVCPSPSFSLCADI